MKPSECFDAAIAGAHCTNPTVNALSFDRFIAQTAKLRLAQDELEASDGISDELAFHTTVMTMLGDQFIPSAWTLKAVAIGWEPSETDNAMPALASDWPWIKMLDEAGRKLYRDLSRVYAQAVIRVATDFGRHGWIIHTDPAL